MGRNPEANEQARRETQGRLRRAALELLATRGVGGTSMAALAKHAGVSKSLAYHYFPNKDALIQAVLDDRIDALAEIAAHVPEGLPAVDRLRAFAHAVAEATVADSARFRLYLRALTDPELRERVRQASLPDRAGFVDLFRAMGAFEPELEADFFQSALLGVLVRSAVSPRPTRVAQLVDRLLDAVIGGER